MTQTETRSTAGSTAGPRGHGNLRRFHIVGMMKTTCETVPCDAERILLITVYGFAAGARSAGCDSTKIRCFTGVSGAVFSLKLSELEPKVTSETGMNS